MQFFKFEEKKNVKKYRYSKCDFTLKMFRYKHVKYDAQLQFTHSKSLNMDVFLFFFCFLE